MTRQRVALALGSGGARGYAHIGAIQVLEERDYEVVAVAGSSMGALVGGLYAAGCLDEFTEWALALTQRDVLRLLDWSISAPGAIRAEKIFSRVRDLVGDVRIEQLSVPYTAVATDLAARREVWFQRGPLETAMRASIAIPGLFTPVMLNGRLLADGGLMDPVPIAPIAAVPADLTVAISLGGDRGLLAPVQETAEARPVEEWRERFRRGSANLLDRDMVRTLMNRFVADDTEERPAEPDAGPEEPLGDAPLGGSPFDPLPAGLSKLDVMNQALDAMQSVVMRYRLAGYPPDVLVEVRKDACRSMDFHRAADLIELGRTLTEEALERVGAGR